MADKIKKNLLGRTVTVKREAMSDGALAKTRTVKSKSGGTISSKTSYKDAGSVAGKMRAKKMNAAPAKTSLATKRGINNAIKRNASLNASEEKAQILAAGMAGAARGVARGAMNAGKTEKRVKMDSKPLKRNAIKLDEAKREYMRNPAKYDAAKVEKAMETGRGRKVQRVMRRESKRGTSSF